MLEIIETLKITFGIPLGVFTTGMIVYYTYVGIHRLYKLFKR